jgi:hypothetical protein
MEVDREADSVVVEDRLDSDIRLSRASRFSSYGLMVRGMRLREEREGD